MPRHLHVATWLGAIATLIAAGIATLNFITGKNKLADFVSSENKDHVSNAGAAGNGGPVFPKGGNSNPIWPRGGETNVDQETNLDQILDLWTPKLTQLESKKLNEKLDGKTVALCGYLIESRSGGLGSSAEVSPSKNGERTLYLNIDSSDVRSWAIAKGSYVCFRTTLKQPWLGRLVGTNTTLVRATREP
jgi:hypothetical protein